MGKILVKGTKITLFQVKQLLKHKPIRVARMLLEMYGDGAEDMAKRSIPECLQKEFFLTELRREKKIEVDRLWNRGKVKI